jgi:chromosomal replication initiator protein
LPLDKYEPWLREYILDGHKDWKNKLYGQCKSWSESDLKQIEVTLDLAKQILKNFVKNNTREISIEFIQKLVCDYFTIPVEQVKSKTRKREIVQARQISMYYAKDLTKSSLKTIGMHFGGRDHSTVIHACQTVNDLMETDKKFRADIEEIGKRIKMNLV